MDLKNLELRRSRMERRWASATKRIDRARKEARPTADINLMIAEANVLTARVQLLSMQVEYERLLDATRENMISQKGSLEDGKNHKGV